MTILQGRGAAAGHGYREHIRRIGEEKLDASGDKRYPARRWVVERTVERTVAWLSGGTLSLRPSHLTDHQAESWLRIGGRFSLVPFSIGFSVLDVDSGPWKQLTAVYPPHAVIPSRKLWRRHLYYSDSEPRSNAQKRKLYGCHVDVRSASGYVALWKPENALEAAEGPRQGVLFPWRMFWPEEGANKTPPGKTPPGKPPAPPGGNPRDGPLNDAYPLTRWNRLLEVVKAWAYIHAREYNKRDTFHLAIRKYAEGRALEMPDLTDFWDGSTNDPAKSAYYVESHAWQFWRPVHAANRRWHNKSNFDLGGRDTSLTAMREKGLNQKDAASLHGLTQGQVSKRLSGGGGGVGARGL